MRIIFFICSFFISSLAFAHQPDISSTVLADKGDGTWVLQIRSALTAFEYEVKAANPNHQYKSPEEFKSMVAKLVEDKMTLSINNSPVELTNAVVKLGHETSIMYTLSDLKNGITNIDITQKSFEHINKNKSALVILKKGTKPQQFMLDNSNNNSAKLNFQEDKFINLSPSTEVHSSTKNMLVYGLGALAIVGLLSFWYFKKRQA